MDDATQGLTELLDYSTEMNTSMNSVAPNIAAALQGTPFFRTQLL